MINRLGCYSFLPVAGRTTAVKNRFVVHGRDHTVRNEVQQVLHSLSIPSIVLDYHCLA
ncbi:hypothetical protein [Hymenobacter terrenus]|uniref:hypothetical protein n=1 Tax=Hymenobacter terrenus TaxID=1629124 RepID=UPI000AB8C8A2|nr:hypothetical protein [Hymenobacter terrenus]